VTKKPWNAEFIRRNRKLLYNRNDDAGHRRDCKGAGGIVEWQVKILEPLAVPQEKLGYC
jgi:hypothetical protein